MNFIALVLAAAAGWFASRYCLAARDPEGRGRAEMRRSGLRAAGLIVGAVLLSFLGGCATPPPSHGVPEEESEAKVLALRCHGGRVQALIAANGPGSWVLTLPRGACGDDI